MIHQKLAQTAGTVMKEETENPKAVDPVNQFLFGGKSEKGLVSLGALSSMTWRLDPRRMTFVMARYKFVSKMLSGKSSVLEVGCGDSFASRIVAQEVNRLTAIDIEPLFIKDAIERVDEDWPIDLRVHDMLSGPVAEEFDAAYSLDVLEHIPSESEEVFLQNICNSITADGVLIIGMPSLESQAYASPQSKAGHINCKSGKDLRSLLQQFFENVFLFSMNDEVVHTGYSKMAHYIFCLCCSPRS